MDSLILFPACGGDWLFVVDFPFEPAVPGSSCQGWPIFVVDFLFPPIGSLILLRLPWIDRLFVVDSLFLGHGLPASFAGVQRWMTLSYEVLDSDIGATNSGDWLWLRPLLCKSPITAWYTWYTAPCPFSPAHTACAVKPPYTQVPNTIVSECCLWPLNISWKIMYLIYSSNNSRSEPLFWRAALSGDRASCARLAAFAHVLSCWLLWACTGVYGFVWVCRVVVPMGHVNTPWSHRFVVLVLCRRICLSWRTTLGQLALASRLNFCASNAANRCFRWSWSGRALKTVVEERFSD